MRTKQLLQSVTVAIVMVLVALPQQIKAQKLKDFQEAMKKPREFAGFYEINIENSRSKEKKIYKLAEENQIRIIDYGWRTRFIPEKEWKDYQHEVEYSQISTKELSPYCFKSIGTAYIYDFYDNGRSLYGAERWRMLRKCSDVKWTGELKNGLLEGRGDGYVITTSGDKNVGFAFQGTFHNGMMVKCTFRRGTWKNYEEYDVEVEPFSEGVAFMKDNALIRSGKRLVRYSLIDSDGHFLLEGRYTSVKQGFKDGKAIVTDRGMDIVIDKTGKFLAIAEDVAEIPQSYFDDGQYDDMTSIIIPPSVTKIGSKAFCNRKKLQEVKILGALSDSGNETFMGCSALRSIDISMFTHKILGYGTFKGCESLNSVTLPQGITMIGDNAFEGCKSLKSIILPTGLKDINTESFKNCTALTDITIPNSVSYIGPNAFSYCI